MRLCDETHERQTHFSIFPTAIVLYSLRAIEEYITLFNANASSRTLFRLGVVPDPPSSKQLLHASKYHVGCLFVQKQTPPLPVRVWPGTRREYVRPACTSSLGAGTYVGGCERDGLCETEAMCL